MNEMVERVARAIWPWLRYGIPNMGKLTWDQVNPGSLAHETALEAARAAIADMREPTEAMVESGASAIRGPHKIFGGPGVLTWARDAWRAMIDEALKP